jgi:hypothetical protein
MGQLTRTRAERQPTDERLDRLDHVVSFGIDQVDQGAHFGQAGSGSLEDGATGERVPGGYDWVQHASYRSGRPARPVCRSVRVENTRHTLGDQKCYP